MASLSNILKKFASVNNSVINSVELTQDSSGVYTVRVHLRPHANHACRCPICGRKGNIYDKAKKRTLLESAGLRRNNNGSVWIFVYEPYLTAKKNKAYSHVEPGHAESQRRRSQGRKGHTQRLGAV